MITGIDASAAYLRRYGCTDQVDIELARLLAEEMVEFDPETEMFQITERGRITLWEAETGNPNLSEWNSSVAN